MFSRKPAAVASGVFAALALAATLLTAGPASAAPGDSVDPSTIKVDVAASKPTKVTVPAMFAAQGRAAGLTAEQAGALQGSVDAYLRKLGAEATQADFNTIALKGANLHVTVPGEAHPRGLAASYCSFQYFCAYEYEWQTGSEIHIINCADVRVIPWFTTGSWVNNQTPGTRPLLTFTNGSTWSMPAAYSDQLTGVGWSPVWKIDPC